MSPETEPKGKPESAQPSKSRHQRPGWPPELTVLSSHASLRRAGTSDTPDTHPASRLFCRLDTSRLSVRPVSPASWPRSLPLTAAHSEELAIQSASPSSARSGGKLHCLLPGSAPRPRRRLLLLQKRLQPIRRPPSQTPVMEQTKALDALEPFLALSKSATSPRAAIDLISRATSAPHAYIFAELLQSPQIQALAQSPDHASHLALLRVFAYGTWQTYHADPGLPAMSDAQAFKLRQLSLLTLARDRTNLSYDALQAALDLDSTRKLEDLVIKAVYEGLLHATLDPARQVVQVTSIAPLRDFPPDSIGDMIAALETWALRCTTTLADIESQMADVRVTARARAIYARASDDRLRRVLVEIQEQDNVQDLPAREALARAISIQSTVDSNKKMAGEETMEIDDPSLLDEQTKRANKRKM